MVGEMQTLHGHSKQSDRSGLGPITFLQTKVKKSLRRNDL